MMAAFEGEKEATRTSPGHGGLVAFRSFGARERTDSSERTLDRAPAPVKERTSARAARRSLRAVRGLSETLALSST
jgi:hypothetical protein